MDAKLCDIKRENIKRMKVSHEVLEESLTPGKEVVDVRAERSVSLPVLRETTICFSCLFH